MLCCGTASGLSFVVSVAFFSSLLGLLRQRARDAFEQKVRRGFALWEVPVGFIRTEEGRIEKTPDRQVQQAIAAVFQNFSNWEAPGRRPSGSGRSGFRCP